MGIKTIKTDLEWGDIFYIKVDPVQQERSLVGIVHLPGGQIQFMLGDGSGDSVILYDFECSKEPDKLKQLKNREDDDGDEPK